MRKKAITLRWYIPQALVIACLAIPCGAQEPGTALEPAASHDVMTNKDIVTLAKAGFSEDFIIQTIGSSRTRFITSADGLAELAKSGISEDVIWAMKRARPGAAPACCALDEKLAASRDGAPEATGGGPEPKGGAAGPPRVYVEPSPDSWVKSRSHAQTAEIMKTFGDSCPNLVVTNRKPLARFTVVLERESGKWLRRDNKMVVFNRAGDMIYQASSRSLGRAVRGFCASPQGRLAGTAR